MKLHFDSNLDYQLDAIDAVVDVFRGQPYGNSSSAVLYVNEKQLSIEQVSARGNILNLSDPQIADNVHSIQQRNGLDLSEIKDILYDFRMGNSKPGQSLNHKELVNDMNFSIEMETGTGKTYVYLRTIHELHKTYGWKKFIIVVPSVAIREGVLKNLEITREHFAAEYDNPEMNFYVWDSKKTGQAREFATNDTL
ncbi:MAG: DEAD/DEAH box helicase family protein [Candidatus Saccharibacteria bacterium]|nr:DEAD/DEAH box helicase family protein [Candidatus Saccharibacteria bacterium]